MLKKQPTTVLQKLFIPECWFACFLLGVISLNFPFISIFNKPLTYLGIPLLFIYLMGGWLLSVLAISILTKLFKKRADRTTERPKP